MFREVKFISVPNGLPRAIINDNKLFKAVVMFYKLKSLYKSGVIKNYTRRYREIAEHPNVNCCESKLRASIRTLRDLGYVCKEGKNLIIRSKFLLKEEFGVSKFSTKIECQDIKNLEYYLKRLIIEGNIEQQRVRVVEKIVADEYSVGKEKGSPESKTFKQLKKFVSKDFNACLKRQQARYAHTVRNNLQSDNSNFYPFLTLSRKGIARNLGKRSKSTGSRYIKKFKDLGYIEKDEPNYIILESDVSYDYYLKFKYNYLDSLLDSNTTGCTHMRFSKGRILLTLANNIQMTLSSKY